MNKEQKRKVRTAGKGAIRNQKGVALVISLIITLVVFLLIMSTLYVVTVSTTMSGVGKRYASASEAADGSVNVVKDAINLAMLTDPDTSMFNAGGSCSEGSYTILEAIMTQGLPCTTSLALQNYDATVTVKRLYTIGIPGGRLEFARSASQAPATAVFFRITTVVKGKNSNDATAENSVLYRFTG